MTRATGDFLEKEKRMDDSPNDPGVANAWDSSDARGAYEDRPPRAA